MSVAGIYRAISARRSRWTTNWKRQFALRLAKRSANDKVMSRRFNAAINCHQCDISRSLGVRDFETKDLHRHLDDGHIGDTYARELLTFLIGLK